MFGNILVIIAVAFVEDYVVDFSLSLLLLGALLIGWSVRVGWRYRILTAPMIGVVVGLLLLHKVAVQVHVLATHQSWMIHLIGAIILLVFSLPSGLLRRKRRTIWNRWIFSHAAANALPGEDGYKRKCVPVRQAEYSEAELRGFAEFLEDRGVALSEWKEDTLSLFLPGDHTGPQSCRESSERCSHIRFEADGQIAAYISQADYRDCGDVLSYTSLCTAFGNIIFDFLQRHRLGEVDLIHREIQDDTREAQAVLVIVGLLSYGISIALYLGLI